jgi:hypothetical protein
MWFSSILSKLEVKSMKGWSPVGFIRKEHGITARTGRRLALPVFLFSAYIFASIF